MFGLPQEIAGTIIAAVIAAVISLLGLIISKESKISEFRQAWIDALRAEIATVITHAHAIHGACLSIADAASRWQNVSSNFVALNEAWSKIRLRLNPKEKSSIAILDVLSEHEALFREENAPPDFSKLPSIENRLLERTQVVLKQEWQRVKRGELVYRGATILAALLLVICGFYVLLKRDSGKIDHPPSLQEAVDYMKRSLASHNGQRIQQPPLSPEVKLVNRLTEDHCKLTYEVSQFDVVQIDLGDIDTKTVTVKQIGNTWWALFKTRDFNKSVQYRHPKDPGSDYPDEAGGFSLDSAQTANSFAKAFAHAADLCGSSPSSF